MESSPLPTRMAVRELVEGLIGRDIELKDATVLGMSPSNVVAVFVTDQLKVAALAVLDFDGAARIGGALGMLPKGGIDDAIKEQDLPTVMRDNTYEVLNVLSAIFNVEGAPHVRLYQMYGPFGSMPNDVAQLAQALGTRLDLELVISGYGSARLSVVIR